MRDVLPPNTRPIHVFGGLSPPRSTWCLPRLRRLTRLSCSPWTCCIDFRHCTLVIDFTWAWCVGIVVHVGKTIASSCLCVCLLSFFVCVCPTLFFDLWQLALLLLVPCCHCGLLSRFNAKLALWLVSDFNLGKSFRLRGSVGWFGIHPMLSSSTSSPPFTSPPLG